MKKSILAMLLLTFFVSPVFAALAICEGKVESIMNRPGYVYLKLDTMGGAIALCSADANSFSISPESCKDFKATVYTAFATGKTLMVYIHNGLIASTNPPYNCPTSMVPNNLHADITYMQLKN